MLVARLDELDRKGEGPRGCDCSSSQLEAVRLACGSSTSHRPLFTSATKDSMLSTVLRDTWHSFYKGRVGGVGLLGGGASMVERGYRREGTLPTLATADELPAAPPMLCCLAAQPP